MQNLFCHNILFELLYTFSIESSIAELEDDEGLVDDAIKHGAIHFLRQNVVASEHFHQEVCECCIYIYNMIPGSTRTDLG